DLTGDGRPEILTHWQGAWGYVAPNWEKVAAPWKFHRIGAPGDWPQFYHGQGAGDLNGDGAIDVVINHGWLEAPGSVGDGSQGVDESAEWKFHPYQFGERGGAQMLVFDVDGDQDNDVVTSLDAHGWGLAWFENRRDEQTGAVAFERHKFMGSREEQPQYGVAFSQPHAMASGDIDGDGLTDVVVGKRRWAHGPRGDVEPNAPAVVYWFRLERDGEGARFQSHLIDDHSGVGLQIAVDDVNGDGRVDILTASKLGTFLFLAESR
ncbi:MAG: VCBS repeat-containing protein, partial [Planctomycetota bacterium]